MNGFFYINGYRDFWQMCRHNYRLFSNKEDNKHYEYKLLNLILSLNHLYDWVIKDENLSLYIRNQCEKKFYPYSDRSNFNTKQYLVRKLSNRGKHFKQVENDPSQGVELQKAFCADMPDAIAGNAFSRETRMFHYVEHDDVKYDVESLCKELFDEWKFFFEDIESVEKHNQV